MAFDAAQILRQTYAAGAEAAQLAQSLQRAEPAAPQIQRGELNGTAFVVESDPLAELQDSMEELAFQFEEKTAKRLSERKVVYHHAFRNTLIPLVTIIGGSLPGLFSGALITETLYAIPGIGYISYQAMVAGDIPFSMFYLVFLAVLTLLGNLIADVLYAVVDPRVRIA